MANNLGSSKIKNTFQKVVQVDPSPTGSLTPYLHDLTGNRIDQIQFAGISGSFSGSFSGDGSNITGVVGEWDGSHLGDASITGSLTVTGAISGSIVSSSGVNRDTKCFSIAMAVAL